MSVADRAKVPTIKDYFIDTGMTKKSWISLFLLGILLLETEN